MASYGHKDVTRKVRILTNNGQFKQSLPPSNPGPLLETLYLS